MIEPKHEVLRAIFAYWLKKKGTRLAPSRSDIDPADIPRLLPYVGMADVERNPLRFRYRLVGTEITRGYAQELTARYLDELDLNAHQHDIIGEYSRVAETADPICSRWEFTRNDGRHVAYERLALPLSGDGKTVDMLFGGCVFERSFPPSHRATTAASRRE